MLGGGVWYSSGPFPLAPLRNIAGSSPKGWHRPRGPQFSTCPQPQSTMTKGFAGAFIMFAEESSHE